VGVDIKATQVIDGDDLDFVLQVRTLVKGANNVAADAAKPVDGDSEHLPRSIM
tara:strand:- start:1209 stop:1367 length:159 start_codon:yes stop_codon:yes gene_type:complete